MDLGVAGIVLRVGLGLVIGFCIGLTGVGGGVLVLPALTLLLRLPASMAVGTASLYAFLTKVTASFHHYRLRTIDMRVAFGFLAGAIPANVAVSVLINVYKNRVEGNVEELALFQSNLRSFIAGVIVLSAVMLILNLFKKTKSKDEESLQNCRKDGSRWAGHLLVAGLGAIIGALVGATSIGGGVLIIPLLIIVVGLSPRKTVGTSIFVAVILTLVTSAVYLRGGEIDLQTAVSMALGSTIGVYWGSKLSVKVPEKALQGIVVGVIIIAGMLMFLKQGH